MIYNLLRVGYRKLRHIPRRVGRLLLGDADACLRHVSGVIHVGANDGQERDMYESLGLDVVWVEAIPSVFSRLQANIAGFPRQKAFQYLLTDKEGEEYEFNIASNGGASSSIFEFGLHKDIWPEVTYVDKIKIVGTTFSTMLKKENIDVTKYQALVMDTQGSELLVLKGAGDFLKNFRYIKTEAADFEAYVGCCKLDELASYLRTYGFRKIRRVKFAEREGGGNCYDVAFRRDEAQVEP